VFRLAISQILGLAFLITVSVAVAGPLDPDCDAGKAAKSAAMKATVGVGGRCTPKEAASDTAKELAGVEEKGVLEKKKDDDDKEGIAKKAAKELVD